jgi:cystathionine beta-lyase/cystathionine gamma-synthase
MTRAGDPADFRGYHLRAGQRRELRNGYEYSRSAHPHPTTLEDCIAALGQGDHGLVIANGRAAKDTRCARVAVRRRRYPRLQHDWTLTRSI